MKLTKAAAGSSQDGLAAHPARLPVKMTQGTYTFEVPGGGTLQVVQTISF